MNRLSIAVAAYLVTGVAHLCAAGHPLQPWKMADDFSNGISSWQSYPLAQDIGYDPSIYNATGHGSGVLVRDVVNEGQKQQSIGMTRPLHFSLTASTKISIGYALQLAGPVTDAKLMLASEDGRVFEAPLPVDSHEKTPLVITGAALKAPQSPAQIESVVLLASFRGAALGAHSYLRLYSFAVAGAREAAMQLTSPQLVESSDEDLPLAKDFAVLGQGAHMKFATAPKTLRFIDGAGAEVSVNAEIHDGLVDWVPPDTAAAGLWTIAADDGAAALRYRMLVLPATPGSGVLFPEQRLEELRTSPRYAPLRASLHREAERYANLVTDNAAAGDAIALLPKESVHAGLTAYLELMTNYGGAISYGALDYRLNGDAQSLDHVRKALMAVAAWKTWTPSWFTAHGMHTYYVAGVFTQQAALGFDLVSEQLTMDEKRRIEDAFLNRSIQSTVDDYFLRDRMPTAASNHMAHSVGGAIAAWAACDRADAEWRKAQAPVLAELLVAYQGLLTGLFPGDGSEREPAGYEVFAMEGMSYGIAALKNLGITPEGTTRMMDSFWWLRYAEVSPQLLLDTGDTGSTLPGLYGYAWLAENSHDAGVRWLYDTVARPSLDQAPQSTGHDQAPPNLLAISRAPNILDLLCCTQPAGSFTPPAPSRIFSGRGSAVLRDGWSADPTVISLRAGPWMNHEHHDQGSFQMAWHGELLVGEGGYADYYRDPNYKDYFSEAAAHNVVLLDNDPFSQVPYDGDHYKSFSFHPRMTSSLLGEAFDFVEADLKAAYGDRLNSYKRTFLYLKPGLLVIHDQLEGNSPHSFQWLLHPAPGAEASVDKTGVMVSGTGKANLVVMASDAKHEWTAAAAPIAINDFTDLDKIPVRPHSVLTLDSAHAASADFLVALAAVDKAATTASGGLERYATGNATGFRRNDANVQSDILYRRGTGVIASGNVSADGDMLAVSGSASGDATEVFTQSARSVHIGPGFGISLSSPATMELDRSHGEVEVRLACEKPTDIHVEGQLNAAAVEVDGKAAAASANEYSVQPGSHLLRFTLKP